MKKDNIPVVKSENIIEKVKNFFKSIFKRSKTNIDKREDKVENIVEDKNSFIEEITIDSSNDEFEMLRQYECGNLIAEDMEEKEIKKLIEIYNEEINTLKHDTDVIKEQIISKSKMLMLE